MNAVRALRQTQLYIKKQQKLKVSNNQIGRDLNVSAAEVQRISKGKYPGEKVAARLGLPVVCHTCKRTMPKPKQPRQPAPKIGQDGWMDYWMRPLRRGAK